MSDNRYHKDQQRYFSASKDTPMTANEYRVYGKDYPFNAQWLSKAWTKSKKIHSETAKTTHAR